MKYLAGCLMLMCALAAAAQHKPIKNVVIVTTDGLRWQEVFRGMEPELANDRRFNQDSTYLYKHYWSENMEDGRRLLFPFLWNKVAKEGQLWGNRDKGSSVNVSNPYWFSYPGYNELLCGFVDTAINTNDYPSNPHTNLLEFLNRRKPFAGKVKAFGAWDAFDRILNEKRSGFEVICGEDTCADAGDNGRLLNAMKHHAYSPFGKEEGLDMFTHYMAMDQLERQHLKLMYIAYGETDEWAHKGNYKDYLDAAHTVDRWLGELWAYLQADKKYSDNTLLIVTVDHGRGNGAQWTSHNSKIPGSDQVWFAIIGPGIKPAGEMNNTQPLYQKQIAKTIASLLGVDFTCEHPTGDSFDALLR